MLYPLRREPRDQIKGGLKMRRWTLAALAGAAFTTAVMPAQAAWKGYVNRELGFSFMAPGEMKSSVGTFRGAIAGPRQTILYRSVEDNIEYKVTVMTFVQAQAEGATLLGEREYMFQDGKKLLTDVFARVGSGKDAVYGRKIVVDLPDNKGRATGAFYFTKGRLISLEATVLPAHGNLASPDPGRFVDSIAFALSRTEPSVVELETPKFD
jgi:hypothetical protein